MPGQRFEGVITPLLTPFNDDGSVADDLYGEHARQMLVDGAHYLSPFGTTGEATSVSLAERRATLESLVSRHGIDASSLMPGTGLCNLPETAELTRHAVELGCAAVMVLPPFFYTAASDDGLFAYMARLIDRVGCTTLRICIYHIPQNAGVGFSPALSARLNEAFPEVVIAYKDSSGDWANTQAVLAAAPRLAVFPASESRLREGLAHGAAGCISATCNLNSAAIRNLFDRVRVAQPDGLDALDDAVKRFRAVFQRAGLIEGMKAYLADLTGDLRWLNVRAPLLPHTREQGRRLAEELP